MHHAVIGYFCLYFCSSMCLVFLQQHVPRFFAAACVMVYSLSLCATTFRGACHNLCGACSAFCDIIHTFCGTCNIFCGILVTTVKQISFTAPIGQTSVFGLCIWLPVTSPHYNFATLLYIKYLHSLHRNKTLNSQL